jgi:methionyl-tRNA formyltransferase
MGRKPVARDCLEALLKWPNVEIVGVLTDDHLEGSVTTALANQHGLPLFRFEAARDAIEAGTLTYDLGVSMLYWRKLTAPFLEHPALGTINFHPAPLPEYKGVGGYNLAILEELKQWAVSAHYVDTQIDTGEIIDVSWFDICPLTETARSLERVSQSRLKEQFHRIVAMALSSDNTRLLTTPNKGGRYLSRSDLEAMKQIDFDTDDVARKVRAFWFPPYDGAYIERDGEKYTLIDRNILESLSEPGVSSLFSPAAKLPPV